jgi:hypothetical protein
MGPGRARPAPGTKPAVAAAASDVRVNALSHPRSTQGGHGVALGLLAAQLALLLVVSAIEYRRYALGVGFGTYAQAWVSIAHGHLNPGSSLIGKSFWRNDAEFALWPLAALYYLFPHPVDLLFVQDLALVATEYVAFRWMQELCVRLPTATQRLPSLLPLLGLGALLVNPFVYYAVAYDFHSEILAACFLVLSGFALWSGRHRWLWCSVPLTLLCSGLGALYLCGLGVAGTLAGGRSRRAGVVIVLAGATWLGLVSALGGNEFGYAQSLQGWFGYLVGPHRGPVGPAEVVVGALTHPGAVARMLWWRRVFLVDILLSAGLVGAAWRWAWPVVLVVLAPSALNSVAEFVSPQAAFQNWAVVPFVAVGSVVLAGGWLSGRRRGPPARATLGRGSLVTWAASLVVLAAVLLPELPSFWVSVDGSAAQALGQADRAIPARAEVIASWGVAGRFAVREDVHGYGLSNHKFPVDRRQVFFVIAVGQGNLEVSPAVARSAVHLVQVDLHARRLLARSGVYVAEWTPPAGTTAVTLPVRG